MVQARVLILRTAGTNCELELAHAFELAGAKVKIAHIQELIRGDVAANGYQIMGFPGGFSYGDDVQSGRMHAIELRSYLQDSLREFIEQGKLIIGICNGLQVLANARLLPYAAMDKEQLITLADNNSNKFECRWVHLQGSSSKCVWFPDDSIIELPVAHAEGKFLVKDETVMATLKEQNQIVFRYVDKDGNSGDYPINPNGSTDDIAGICDPSGRILGLMPHPERFVRAQAHPSWTRRPAATEGDGLALFRNGVKFVEAS